MSENVTNELILEHLKAIRAKLTGHDERFQRLEDEMRAMKAHLAGLVRSDLARDTEHASLAIRVERIERRLELGD